MLVLLTVGVVGNVGEFIDQHDRDRAFHPSYRETMLAMPHLPLARDVPRALRPEPLLGKGVTVGWLLAGADSGRIPRPAITPVVELTATLHLALQQKGDFGRAFRSCAPLERSIELTAQEGDAIFLRGGNALVWLRSEHNGQRSEPKRLPASHGGRVMALAGPLRLEIAPNPLVQFCGIERARPQPGA
jgi:hypothetical protein